MRNIYILISFFTFCAWTTVAQNLVLNVGSGTGGCGSGSIEIDVTADNFTDLTSLDFSVNWDVNVVSFDTVKNINSKLGNAILNTQPSTTAAGKMSFSWFNGANPETLDASDNVIFTVVFNPAGGGTSTPVSIADDPTAASSSDQNGTSTPIAASDRNNGTITINNTASDSEDPVLVDCPADIEIMADANATTAVATWTAPTATDDCSTPTIATTHQPGSSFEIGTTVVTYTATDAAGKMTTCDFSVTVQENSNDNNDTGDDDSMSNGKLVLIASTNTIDCDANRINVDITTRDFININSIDLSVQWDANVLIYDAITNVNPLFGGGALFNEMSNGQLGFSWFSGNDNDLVDNSVLFTIQFISTGNGTGSSIVFGDEPTPIFITSGEDSGNKQSYSDPNQIEGLVTINADNDDTPPVISSCPSDILVRTAEGGNSAIVEWLLPVANDDCGTPTVTSTHQSGDSFPVGSTTVTYTYTDAANNSSVCEFIVTVEAVPGDVLTIEASNEIQECSGEEITVDITTTNFNKISGLEFSLKWDETVLNFVRLSNLNTDLGLADGNFNTSINNEGKLSMSWFNGLGSSLADNTILFSIVLSPVSNVNTITNITFTDDPTPMNATVVDENGGTTQIVPVSSPGQVTLRLSDEDPPVFTSFPTDTTISTTPTDCTVIADWDEPTATDNCGTVNVELTNTNINQGDALSPGTYPVTYRATDATGNSIDSTFTITVIDEAAPVFTSFPNNIRTAVNVDRCVVEVNWNIPTAMDNCDGTIVPESITNRTPGTPFGVGVTTVTYRATDAAGNAVDSSFTITVRDVQLPTLTCPADITEELTEGQTTISIDNIAPINVDDNCTVDSVLYRMTGATVRTGENDASGTTFNEGETMVTYVVVDQSGNRDSCDFFITINPPRSTEVELSCPSDSTIAVAADRCTQIVNNIGVTVNNPSAENISSITWAMSGATVSSGENDASGQLFNIGITTVTYTVTTFDNKVGSCSFDIHIRDTTPPVLDGNCPANSILNNDFGECGANVSFELPSATDNCSVIVTSSPVSGSFFPIGATTVIVTATDLSGNTDQCSILIRVNDTQIPEITCPTDQKINSDVPVVVENIDPVFSDNCPNTSITYSLGGATTAVGTDSASGETFNVGETTVGYRVTDAAGNTEFCTFTIVVGSDVEGNDEGNNDVPPVSISCPNDTIVEASMGMCEAIVNDLMPTFNDSAVIATIEYSLSGATVDTGMQDASGNTFNLGTTMVNYLVIDSLGRRDSCSFTVTVNDLEAPVYECISDTTLVAGDDCTATFDWSGLVSVSDNCSDAAAIIQTSTHDSGTTAFPIGMTEVTLTATDEAGNMDTCQFIVNVVDQSMPVTTNCPDNIVQDNDTQLCGAFITWEAPVFVDNCTPTDSLVITSTHTPNSFFEVGRTTVTYTATDASDNTTSCTFEVIIQDAESPVATNCPRDTTIFAVANCQTTYSWTPPTITDNCTENILPSSNIEPGSIFPLGSTEVRYRASDDNANTDLLICSFTVTVIDTTAPVLARPSDVIIRADGTVRSDPDGIIRSAVSDACTSVRLSFELPSIAEDGCDERIIISRTDNTGLNSGDAFPVGTTTLMYEAVDFSGNIAAHAINITIEENEPLQIVANQIAPCTGESVRFITEDIEGGTYEWQLPDNTTVREETLDIDSITMAQSGLYMVRVTAPDGCQYSGTYQLLVSPTPVLSITTSNDMLCAQEMQTLTLEVSDISNAEDLEYKWTGPNNFSANVANPSIANAGVENAGIYTVTVTTGQGCTAVAEIEINIVERPENITLLTSTEGACLGDVIQLEGTDFESDAITYHWISTTTEDGLTDSNSPINIVQPTAAGTYTYGYYATIGSCVSDTATVTIVVEGQPEVALAIVGETTCVTGDSDIVLQTSSTGEVVENWSWTGPQDFSSNEQSPTIAAATALNSGLYILTATTRNGCQVSDTLAISISDQPTTPTITTSADANCLGNSFELSTTAYEGAEVTYQWNADAAAGLPVNTNSSTITVSPTTVGNYNYSLTVIANGCTSTTANINIDTQAPPSLDLSNIPTMLNCVDGTTNLVLQDSNNSDANYEWLTPSNITLSGNNATINNITSADAGTYQLTVTTAIGCATIDSVSIAITDALPTPEIEADIELPCAGDDVRLAVLNPIPDAIYEWVGPSNYKSVEVSPIINNIGDQFVGSYFVKMTKDGCTSATSAAYSLVIQDTPDLQDDNFEAIVETPITLDILANDLLIANANISVGVLSSTFNGQLENNQDGTFTYTPAQGSRGFDQFVYQVCYTDCKDNCEIANVSIETKFAPDECVPFNIISPNGDGQNDEFVISCVDNTANFPNNSLVILNQWGDEVFRAAPYRNNWSGTYNGSSLPDGTYYYIFIPDTTGSDPQTGFITIQR